MGHHEELTAEDGGQPSHLRGDAIQANHIQDIEEEHFIAVLGHEGQHKIEAT
jgi:hypothetical protein